MLGGGLTLESEWQQVSTGLWTLSVITDFNNAVASIPALIFFNVLLSVTLLIRRIAYITGKVQ